MIRIEDVEIKEIDYAIRGNANLGIKETGKTYAAMWFSERLMDANIPIVAIDPSGVWRYLKVPRAGKQGYPVVVVGDDGDIPLSPDTAGSIMRAAMEAGVSVVFDLFSKHLSKADWRKIVREICEVLLYENKDFGLRHLFLEEAKEYVPQQVYDKLVFSAVEKLIRMGGNSQVGITLINQRAEGINKEVLELCAALFVFKQVGRNSITNLEKWLKKVDIESDEITRSLFTLPKGNCWFFDEDSRNPMLIKIPEKNTVHPDRRAMTSTNISIAQKAVDVSAFVERLNKALAKQKTAKPESVPHEARAGKIFVDPKFELKNPLTEHVLELEKKLDVTRTELQKERKAKQDALDKLDAVRNMLMPQYQQMQTIFSEVGNGHSTETSADSGKYAHWFPKLVGKQKDMLQAFIEHKRLTRRKLGLIIGMTTKKNGTFTEYVRQLKMKGLITEEGDELVLQELS